MRDLPPSLSQCLAHDRRSINVDWLNEWIKLLIIPFQEKGNKQVHGLESGENHQLILKGQEAVHFRERGWVPTTLGQAVDGAGRGWATTGWQSLCERTQWPGTWLRAEAQQCQTSAFLCLKVSSGICWMNDVEVIADKFGPWGEITVNLRTTLLSKRHSPYPPTLSGSSSQPWETGLDKFLKREKKNKTLN